MVVTWTTFNSTANSTVWYGIGAMNQVAYGAQTKFVDERNSDKEMFIHRVYLSELLPSTTYSKLFIYFCKK